MRSTRMGWGMHRERVLRTRTKKFARRTSATSAATSRGATRTDFRMIRRLPGTVRSSPGGAAVRGELIVPRMPSPSAGDIEARRARKGRVVLRLSAKSGGIASRSAAPDRREASMTEHHEHCDGGDERRHSTLPSCGGARHAQADRVTWHIGVIARDGAATGARRRSPATSSRSPSQPGIPCARDVKSHSSCRARSIATGSPGTAGRAGLSAKRPAVGATNLSSPSGCRSPVRPPRGRRDDDDDRVGRDSRASWGPPCAQ